MAAPVRVERLRLRRRGAAETRESRFVFIGKHLDHADLEKRFEKCKAAKLRFEIGSKVEAAYRRGNLLTKRRQMMADWDAFLAGKDRKVIQLHETGDAR